MGHHRGMTPGIFALEIEGHAAGWVYSVEGGSPVGDVVVEKLGLEHYMKKHVGGIKYEDITITCGMGMTKWFWDQLHKSFTDDFKRLNGAIHFADYDGNVIRTLEFYGAPIVEIGFPALDASSKDAAKLTLKLTPEYTIMKKGSGKLSLPQHPLGSGQQKKWSPANFRLKIDGLDEACSRVNKIDGLTIKQKVAQNIVGESSDYSVEPCALEIPNLVITTSEISAHALYHWRHQFLVLGHNSEEHEKTGTLEYLTADLKSTLFSIDMHHIGIFKMTPDKAEAGGESIRRVKAEMYVESMKFEYKGGSTWA